MDGDRDASGEHAVDRTKECSPVTIESVPTEQGLTESSSSGDTAPHAATQADRAHPAVTRPAAARPTAREINAQIVYTAFAVYSRVGDLDGPAEKATAELVELVRELAEQGVTLRGFYDVSALRADADLMVWWHAPTAEALQAAARSLRRTAVGRTLTPSWSAMG